MSGPKVVRIVTREEILAICEAHLQRLATAFERWQTQAGRIGELSEADRAAAVARHARLCALLQQDQLRELQKAVPIEIDLWNATWKARGTGDHPRNAKAPAAAACPRKRGHPAQGPAGQARPGHPRVAARDQRVGPGRFARRCRCPAGQGVRTSGHGARAGNPRCRAARPRPAAQERRAGPSLADWINSQPLDSSRDVRLLRIDRHIAELQLLQGVQAAEPFVLRLEKAEAESRPQTHNLLLDSLVLDLAHATRLYQQQRAHFNQLQDLASEVAAFQDTAHQSLLEQVAGCEANRTCSSSAV